MGPRVHPSWPAPDSSALPVVLYRLSYALAAAHTCQHICILGYLGLPGYEVPTTTRSYSAGLVFLAGASMT